MASEPAAAATITSKADVLAELHEAVVIGLLQQVLTYFLVNRTRGAVPRQPGIRSTATMRKGPLVRPLQYSGSSYIGSLHHPGAFAES